MTNTPRPPALTIRPLRVCRNLNTVRRSVRTRSADTENSPVRIRPIPSRWNRSQAAENSMPIPVRSSGEETVRQSTGDPVRSGRRPVASTMLSRGNTASLPSRSQRSSSRSPPSSTETMIRPSPGSPPRKSRSPRLPALLIADPATSRVVPTSTGSTGRSSSNS